MLRIAILDNHFIYRKGLSFVLHKNFPEVLTHESDVNIDIERDLVPFQPDLVILHLNNIHEREGFGRATKLRDLLPGAALIIYEDNVSYNKALKALRVKVSGYLDKASDEEEIVKCVNLVAAGKNYLCKHIQQHIIEQVVQKKLPFKTQGLLSLRESEIARLVSEGEKTSGIALMLGLKSSTVSTVKATVFAKLDVQNVVELRARMAEL